MLGWFKKKFTKTDETIPNAEQELAPQNTDLQHPISEDTPEKTEEAPLSTDEEPSPPWEATQEAEHEGIDDPPPEEKQAPAPEPEQESPSNGTTQESSAGAIGSMFSRLSNRLSRTKESLVYRMDALFLGKKEINTDLFDELEEILITADLGMKTTMELLDDARKRVKRDALSNPTELKNVLKEKLKSFITASNKDAELVMPKKGPFVIMVVGVNGVGKTTTIGKVVKKFKKSGQSVLLVAADTFRAAAVAQLQIWGDRNGVDVVSQHEGADPSAVAFDAMDRAVAENYDVVIIDTAGRLHTQVNLMEELKKIKRVIGKRLHGAPHEIMLVLDATTGQNSISQAVVFDDAVGVTGLALTKLDGTAKGGIVASICRELSIPIRFIGIGEQIDDLRDFDPDEFIDALFGDDSYQS